MNEHETRLRDEFAMEAFKAVMVLRPEHYSMAGKEVREYLAQDIWALADAMVQARSSDAQEHVLERPST